jgi:hypothetical protein
MWVGFVSIERRDGVAGAYEEFGVGNEIAPGVDGIQADSLTRRVVVWHAVIAARR